MLILPILKVISNSPATRTIASQIPYRDWSNIISFILWHIVSGLFDLSIIVYVVGIKVKDGFVLGQDEVIVPQLEIKILAVLELHGFSPVVKSYCLGVVEDGIREVIVVIFRMDFEDLNFPMNPMVLNFEPQQSSNLFTN